MLVNKHVVGKYRVVNWNEWLRSMLAREVEQASLARKGIYKERGYAVNLLALGSAAVSSNSILLLMKALELARAINDRGALCLIQSCEFQRASVSGI